MTSDITLKEIQELMLKYYYERDRKRGLYPTFAWFIEEVGELAESILNNNKESVEEEIADVLAWLTSIANLLGVDMEKAFKKKYMNPVPPT